MTLTKQLFWMKFAEQIKDIKMLISIEFDTVEKQDEITNYSRGESHDQSQISYLNDLWI